MEKNKSPKYLGAMLAGPISRSDKTAALHRAFRDGIGMMENFEGGIARDRSELISAQENFAFISGGQADWLDLLRPLAKGLGGFERRQSAGEDAIGPVTRWFRTNSFYRKPTIIEKLQTNGRELANALPDVKNGVAFLLGPHSFGSLVENKHYGDRHSLMDAYMEVVAANMPAVMDKGYKCILFLEPSVGYGMSTGAFTKIEGYEKLYPGVCGKGMKIGSHFPLADGAKALPLVEGTPLDFVGIDGIHSDFGKISTSKDVLIGLVDGARAGIESGAHIEKEAARFIANAKFSGGYYIGPNDRLFDVPFGIAIEKIRALSQYGEKIK
ncbi:MAG: hypothetical protein AABX01_02130 [Candidatus Micrarchaeota archaeon]